MPDPLPIQVHQGEPTEIRVEYEGRKYQLRLGVHVFQVTSDGTVDPNGMPSFNVNAAPVMMVTREEDA